MTRRPPRTTRTDTLFPYPTLFRSGDLIIAETSHGFVCANAGVDLSNIQAGYAALLPVDSDRSARRIRDAVRHRLGIEVAVIVSDTFGRRSEEHTSELQSLMRISYAVFCLKKKNNSNKESPTT